MVVGHAISPRLARETEADDPMTESLHGGGDGVDAIVCCMSRVTPEGVVGCPAEVVIEVVETSSEAVDNSVDDDGAEFVEATNTAAGGEHEVDVDVIDVDVDKMAGGVNVDKLSDCVDAPVAGTVDAPVAGAGVTGALFRSTPLVGVTGALF